MIRFVAICGSRKGTEKVLTALLLDGNGFPAMDDVFFCLVRFLASQLKR